LRNNSLNKLYRREKEGRLGLTARVSQTISESETNDTGGMVTKG
jgi:hypothetical protein